MIDAKPADCLNCPGLWYLIRQADYLRNLLLEHGIEYDEG